MQCVAAMKSALLLLALFGLAAAGSRAFDAYVAKYQKSYASDATEYARRFDIWTKNVAAIQKEQAELRLKGDKPWMGVNQFTDMTAEEFKNSGYIQKRSFKVGGGDVDAVSCLANGVEFDPSTVDVKAAPDSFTWLGKGVVSPIQDQGQCGSCWAFSTISAVESALAIKSGNLTKLSEQEIVDCSTACVLEMGQQVCNQGCNGGWPWSALTDLISWKGEELETLYPYTAVDGTCARKAENTILPIQNYTCLSGPKLADEAVMAAFLAANGPLSIAMDAGILQSYKSGIIKPGRLFDKCSKTQLDHAINIVGYGVEGTTNFWIVRNSWGTSWGESGYFRIVRGEGACGLNAGVVFPLV